VRLVALALTALMLTACESNQERSAKLEKVADAHKGEAARRRKLAQQALAITRTSTKLKVVSSAVVSGTEGAAAVVSLRNDSDTTLGDVPIQIDVRDSRGVSVYRNDIPGLSATLLSVALVPAHATLTWIDDQIQSAAKPASVSVRVGEGTPEAGVVPAMSITGAHLAEAQAEGNLVNHSSVEQPELVIDAVARRAGRVVAAGRALLAQAPAGASTPFQIFFVGNPAGAKLEFSATASKAA
jgi:hypothetical protein